MTMILMCSKDLIVYGSIVFAAYYGPHTNGFS